MSFSSEYPVFYVTVDVVVLTICDDLLCALVVERRHDPFRGFWALPGGFVEPGEGLYDAAVRELEEETGVATGLTRLEQLASYGEPGRDPRGRVVSVAWLGVAPNGPRLLAGSDAARAAWQPVAELTGSGQMAFDHRQILTDGVERARSKLEYTAMATAFLAEEFTIADLRRVYQVIWGSDLDPGNFHRKVTNAEGFLEATGRTVQRGPGRPAELYRRAGADELQPPLLRTSMR